MCRIFQNKADVVQLPVLLDARHVSMMDASHLRQTVQFTSSVVFFSDEVPLVSLLSLSLSLLLCLLLNISIILAVRLGVTDDADVPSRRRCVFSGKKLKRSLLNKSDANTESHCSLGRK